MSAPKPSAPIWCDTVSGLAVWVHRDLVEFTMPDGWSGRLSASEAATTAAGFADAVAEARGWADRWDATTGSYRDHLLAVLRRRSGGLPRTQVVAS